MVGVIGDERDRELQAAKRRHQSGSDQMERGQDDVVVEEPKPQQLGASQHVERGPLQNRFLANREQSEDDVEDKDQQGHRASLCAEADNQSQREVELPSSV